MADNFIQVKDVPPNDETAENFTKVKSVPISQMTECYQLIRTGVETDVPGLDLYYDKVVTELRGKFVAFISNYVICIIRRVNELYLFFTTSYCISLSGDLLCDLFCECFFRLLLVLVQQRL